MYIYCELEKQAKLAGQRESFYLAVRHRAVLLQASNQKQFRQRFKYCGCCSL